MASNASREPGPASGGVGDRSPGEVGEVGPSRLLGEFVSGGRGRELPDDVVDWMQLLPDARELTQLIDTAAQSR